MNEWYVYLIVFATGGLVCFLGQVLIIKTKMTSARILVTFVVLGVVLEAVGIFQPISDFCKAGINVPIIGFGASLARGAINAVKSTGILGIFTGGLTATAGGIAAAIFFAFIFGIIFKARTKKL